VLIATTVLAMPAAQAEVPDAAEIDIEDTIATAAPTAESPRQPPRRRFYVRAGAAVVAPLSTSRELELADIDGAASLAVDNGPIAGSGASVSSATAIAVTLGYRIAPRIAVEAVLGVPFTVRFRATGTLANESIAPMALGGIATGVPALGSELGEAKAAPPTVTATYELGQGRIRPYAGTGLTVLFAYDAKVTNPILAEVGEPRMSIAPAPGLVLQGGLDARITDRIFARLDVKFIAFLLARARVEHLQVRTPELPVFDTVEVGTAKMSIWVNPVIVQLGVGTDF
jgi:outer membrane protein W